MGSRTKELKKNKDFFKYFNKDDHENVHFDRTDSFSKLRKERHFQQSEKENINSKSFTVICKPVANNKGNSNAISSMSKLMQYNPWLLSHMPLKMKSTTLPKAWCYNVISLSR